MEKICPGACHNPGRAIGADTLSQCHPDLILLAFTCCCPKRHQETSEAEWGRGGPWSPDSPPCGCSRKVVTEMQEGKSTAFVEPGKFWALGAMGKLRKEKRSGSRVCPRWCRESHSIPLSGSDYKKIIKHRDHDLCPKMGILLLCVRVGKLEMPLLTVLSWARCFTL